LSGTIQALEGRLVAIRRRVGDRGLGALRKVREKFEDFANEL
jgi:hypothetical protein